MRGFAVTHEMAPSEVLRRLDVFFAHLDLDLLATAFFGWVHPDPAGGLVLRWCNAGHLPPLVVGADGETVILETRNDLLLGLGLETSRADLSLRLEAGSTLLLYSDGLIETRNADLDHGLERLRTAARSVATLDVAELCDELVSAMVGVSRARRRDRAGGSNSALGKENSVSRRHCLQLGTDGCGAGRSREEVALGVLTADRGDLVALGMRLDAFCGDGEAEDVCQVRDGGDDGAAGREFADVGDETLIDLDDVDRQPS